VFGKNELHEIHRLGKFATKCLQMSHDYHPSVADKNFHGRTFMRLAPMQDAGNLCCSGLAETELPWARDKTPGGLKTISLTDEMWTSVLRSSSRAERRHGLEKHRQINVHFGRAVKGFIGLDKLPNNHRPLSAKADLAELGTNGLWRGSGRITVVHPGGRWWAASGAGRGRQ